MILELSSLLCKFKLWIGNCKLYSAWFDSIASDEPHNCYQSDYMNAWTMFCVRIENCAMLTNVSIKVH